MSPPLTESTCIPNPSFPKANIYIRNFHACIADFGISTIARPEPWANSSTAPAVSLVSFTSGGSIRWMSPELFDPKRFNLPDPRPTKESDRFALGMVIYEVRFCQLLVLFARLSYRLIGVVRPCPVPRFGSREGQWCGVEWNSTVQTEGSGTHRTR